MESNEKVYKHTWVKILPLIFVVVMFSSLMGSVKSLGYFYLIIIGISLFYSIHYLTSRVKISETEISTQSWLGTKSLRWNEIVRSSMPFTNLRLHNYDGDMTLSLDSQLPGYPEIVDTIFKRCPGLLDLENNKSISGGILQTIPMVISGLVFLGLAISVLLSSKDLLLPGLFLMALGLIMATSFLLRPRGIEMNGDNLTIRYLFRETTLPSSEIRGISLEAQRSKSGMHFFPLVNLANGKRIRLPGFKPGGIITYQLLKRWHEKATAPGIPFPR
jgi:hypothetical protein